MKILLIRNLNPFFDSSASGNRFASLISGLIKYGAEVSILVTGGYNYPTEKKFIRKDINLNGVEIKYLRSIPNHSIWWRRFNKYILNKYFKGFIKKKIKHYIVSYKGDYIWITNELLILSAFVDCYYQLQCKSLIEINEFHDIYKLHGKVTNKLQLKEAKELEALFLETIKHIDCFAIMTHTLLDFYRKKAKAEATFLHLPMTVDISRFDIAIPNEQVEKYIAFAGSFDNNKDGLDILIESFGKINVKYPEYKLKIAGFYHPDFEKQKSIIRQYNIQNKVEYIGVLNRSQIPKFLINASILALARPDSHQAQGGFPTKLGEYLSTKKPVCVTTTGEIGNYLTDNVSAFIAKPGSVESFSDALDRAMRDEENARNIGLAGFEVAKKNFDKDLQAKRLYDFLLKNIK